MVIGFWYIWKRCLW